MATSMESYKNVSLLPMMDRAQYDMAHVEPFPLTDHKKEDIIIIMHSSGSTGFPKPIYTNHVRYTTSSNPGPGTRDMMTLPLFHAFSFTVSVQRIYHRKTIFFPNSNLPLTCGNLSQAIIEAQPAVLNIVPYILKMLSEEARGVEALKICEQVISAGSGCPDDIGDRLIDQGVNLATYFASTETAMLGTSLNRPQWDNAWSYVRPSPKLLDHIWPKPLGDGTFEFVYLEGFPSLVTTNSDEPPHSYHSKDIFVPHPIIANAWKHVGRIDDRITLLNGEKFLPLMTESRVQEHAYVLNAIVFGNSRPIPGMLVVRSEAAKDLIDEDFIDAIYPTIHAANLLSEGFASIGREMIVPLPAGSEIPVTDKHSLIREQVYRVFQDKIQAQYDGTDSSHEEIWELSASELTEYLGRTCRVVTGIPISHDEIDFFSAGMDSQQAIRFRAQISRDLHLRENDKGLNQNIVFETGNIRKLSAFLHSLRKSQNIVEENVSEIINRMIEKYSELQEHAIVRESEIHENDVILLTGVTGAVGAHILARMLQQSNAHRVMCPVRGHDPELRLRLSLESRGLLATGLDKVVILRSDLSSSNLGCTAQEYTDLAERLTHIIHCAWPVNFQINLQSFEPHIAGVRNLLELSMARKSEPAHFIFCSSITAALGAPAHTTVEESPIDDLSFSSSLGYGRSKLVAEKVIQAAVTKAGANATILRIGQVTGDQKRGLWNDTEMIPMIIRSGLQMGALPPLDWDCRWLPVDTLADCVLEIAGLISPAPAIDDYNDTIMSTQNSYARGCGPQRSGDSSNVVTSWQPELCYNICSPHTFSWTSDLLPALTRAGLKFETIPFDDWLSQLRKILASIDVGDDMMKHQPAPNNAKSTFNDAAKLIEYLQGDFLADSKPLTFRIDKAMRDSPALRKAPRIIEDGLVSLMVKEWAPEKLDLGGS
ncbi:MAG: hypothetical protein Q9222_001421 [Ikaeria aurantiellina]